MQAIEFKAKASDGNIRIPHKFHGYLNGRFKVILLSDEKDMEEKEDAALLNLMEEGRKTPLVAMSKISATLGGGK